MSVSCAPGALGKLLVKDGASAGSEPAYDWTAGNRYAYVFNHETLGTHQELLTGEGIVGDRSPLETLVREGNEDVGGMLEINASPGMFLTWLPRAFGGTFSGSSITLANSLSPFGILVAKSVTKDIELRDCLVDSMLIHGVATPGGVPPKPLACQFKIVGKVEKEPAVVYSPWTFPTVNLGTGIAYAPLVMSDADPNTVTYPGICTIGGTAYQLKEFWLLISNFVHQRWVMSKTATLLCPQGRVTQLRARLAYDGDAADFNRAVTDNVSPTAGVLKFTNQTVSTRFDFPNLKKPKNPAGFILGKTEVDITAQWTAFPSGASKEVTVTNDSTT